MGGLGGGKGSRTSENMILFCFHMTVGKESPLIAVASGQIRMLKWERDGNSGLWLIFPYLFPYELENKWHPCKMGRGLDPVLLCVMAC